jgi:opacity protein-like surface antigen
MQQLQFDWENIIMNAVKIALLGTAALAAVSVSARADDLADLKAQIEALNSRISSLESTPSVPAGYQLLTINDAPAIVNVGFEERKGLYNANATNIGILPTADMPATTNIQWSGFVRTALNYSDISYDANYGSFDPRTGGTYLPVEKGQIDILTRGEIKVVGTTETAVGEVGVQMKLRANAEGLGNPNVVMPDGSYGWWKMTPELMLSAGYNGTLANIGYGYDGACTCYYTDNAPVDLNPGDRTQMRLTYASGPISMAIALEDSDINAVGGEDSLGVAAEFKFSGDTFSGEIAGGYWDSGDNVVDDQYQIGAGISFGLGDVAKLSMGAGFGRDPGYKFNKNTYFTASMLASANVSDSVSVELGFGYSDFNDSTRFNAPTNNGEDVKVMAVLGGIYYNPVSQLTIGLEAEYQDWNSNQPLSDVNALSADLVTVFRF